MMNKIKSAKVHLIKFLFALPIVAVLLLAFRQGREAQFTGPLTMVTVMDTLPAPISIPGQVAPNEKGYYLSVADNNGECIVIIKDRLKSLVKAVLLTDWNNGKEQYEATYGKLQPPPPPLAPPSPDKAPLAPPSPDNIAPPPPPPPAKVSVAVAPKPAAAPKPPKAPKMPANVKSISFDGEKMKIQLKNGKTENYNLSIPSEKAAYEKKYGSFPDPESAPKPGTVIEEVVVIDQSPSIVEDVSVKPVVVIDAVKVEKPTDVKIVTKVNASVVSDVNTALTIENQPVYYIDEKEATISAVNALPAGEISEVRVIKGKEAVNKYGQKGKNGVILIKLKKSKKLSLFNPFAAYTTEKDKC